MLFFLLFSFFVVVNIIIIFQEGIFLVNNPGKKWEQNFKENALKQDLFIIRFNDSDLSFNENKDLRSKFTPKSPADFMIYQFPNIFFFELKSTHYKGISFQRDPEETAMIKLDQINSLIKLSQAKGSNAGFVLNFRNDKEGEPYSEDTFYISISNFCKFYNETDKKSISKLDIVQNGGIRLQGAQKRKYYVYDIEKMLREIVSQEEGY